MSSFEEKKKITLTACDGQTFNLDEAVALEMRLIKDTLGAKYSKSIPVSNVTGSILAMVVEFCKKHVEDKSAEITLKNFDAEFIEDHQDDLLELISAAHFLDIKSLLDLTCQTLANSISCLKTPEEVRKAFDITSTFTTPEEEDKVRMENLWAFDDFNTCEEGKDEKKKGLLLVMDSGPRDDRLALSNKRPRASTQSRPQNKNVKLDDLSNDALEHILSRLPCHKAIARFRCVSKRWNELMSQGTFIKRFLGLQGQQPMVIVMDYNGMSLPNRPNEPDEDDKKDCNDDTPSSNDELGLLCNRLYELQDHPFFCERTSVHVLGTYNDLVLLTLEGQLYICNPHTCEFVTIPNPSTTDQNECETYGIICDLPYYQCMGEQNAQSIQLYPGFRLRVVRYLIHYSAMPDSYRLPNSFRLQIFSSETFEWTDHTVPVTSEMSLDEVTFNNCQTVPYNGVLYTFSRNVLIAVDPFKIIDDPSYKCRIQRLAVATEFRYEHIIDIKLLGAGVNCLQLVSVHDNVSSTFVRVWELNEGDATSASFSLREMSKCDMDCHTEEVLAFDPMDPQNLYARQHSEQGFVINLVNNGKVVIKIADSKSYKNFARFFPLVRQHWPTPLHFNRFQKVTSHAGFTHPFLL